MYDDTIVALATPPGVGALAIVRLSGPEAIAIADRCFRSPRSLADQRSHQCVVGEIAEDDSPIDQVVATIFRAPCSYTGEDIVEFTGHGGRLLTTRIVDLLCRHGARAAREGEFTLRAYLNGKMDLAQAEAVAALIGARSAAGARAALRVLSGGLCDPLENNLARLTELLAELEATLDIQEDGSPDVLSDSAGDAGTSGNTRERIAEQRTQLEALAAGGHTGRLLEEGIRIALVGRPNAGKSSLFNAFLSRDRAIVSPEAGTTRDALEEWVEWNSLPIVLLDTAGLRDPQSNIEEEGLKRTQQAIDSATLVVLVLDACQEGPAELAEQLRDLDLPPEQLVVALHKWDQEVAADWREDRQGHPSSSVVGSPGIDELKATLLARLETGLGDPREALLVGDRQRGLIAQAIESLKRAEALDGRGKGEELVAHELRAALDSLGEILGRRVGPMVLERIFARFCVGK